MLRTAEDLAKEVEELREAHKRLTEALNSQMVQTRELEHDHRLLEAKYQALRGVVRAHLEYLSLTI